MTQREACEAWYVDQFARLGQRNDPAKSLYTYADSHTHVAWLAWQAATRHAADLALDAPVKTSRQEAREACANWILGGME